MKNLLIVTTSTLFAFNINAKNHNLIRKHFLASDAVTKQVISLTVDQGFRRARNGEVKVVKINSFCGFAGCEENYLVMLEMAVPGRESEQATVLAARATLNTSNKQLTYRTIDLDSGYFQLPIIDTDQSKKIYDAINY